jgi:hypothetical protein
LIKSDKQKIFWHFRCLQVHPTLPMELWSDASFCSDTSSFDQIDQIQVSFPGHRDGWCGLGPRFTKLFPVYSCLFRFQVFQGTVRYPEI